VIKNNRREEIKKHRKKNRKGQQQKEKNQIKVLKKEILVEILQQEKQLINQEMKWLVKPMIQQLELPLQVLKLCTSQQIYMEQIRL